MERFNILLLIMAVTVQVTSQDSTGEPPIQISKPKITLNPSHAVLYSTETVTLHCEVPEEPTGLQYDWYKDSADLSEHQPSITARGSGTYECKAKKGASESEKSASYTLTLKDPPKAKLTMDPKWTEFFPNENINLQCEIEGGSSGWTFQWMKDTWTSENNSVLAITLKHSDSGKYSCKGKLKNRQVTTQQSNAFQLNVKVPPEPKIQSDWTEAFPGEKVSLQCVIQGVSENWNYMWFNDLGKIFSSRETNIKGNTLTLSVKSSHNYMCQAKLRGRKVTTAKSTPHLITVKELPQLKLSIESQWNMFYPTEKVTMKCSVDDESNKWGYEWFKNGGLLQEDENISFSGNTLSISSAKAGHSGQYTCRGKHLTRTSVTTRETEAVQLHIQDIKPKPTITKNEWFEFFYTEERVQLKCNMTGVGWEYKWYKDLNFRITNPELTINAVSLNDAGDYYCKAQRGDFSVDSETLQVRVQTRPPAFLRMETELSDIMTGDVTLRCNVSDGRQWNYTWFMNGQELNGSSDVLKVTGNEETIESEFKCKGINTERPLYSALSDGSIANNIIFKRKILLAISGCLVCCIVILIIGCIILKITRKPEVKETAPEDLFFSMTDSKNKTISPMKEYMDNRSTELEECQEKAELIADRVSAVHEDGVIKDEDTPASEANGLTSFKVHRLRSSSTQCCSVTVVRKATIDLFIPQSIFILGLNIVVLVFFLMLNTKHI
uniref:Ig-like domain-containing protein n=1 Tax=Cyprinus carpio TaxID=7962 RepID=A0A8C2BUH5_CYPCA